MWTSYVYLCLGVSESQNSVVNPINIKKPFPNHHHEWLWDLNDSQMVGLWDWVADIICCVCTYVCMCTHTQAYIYIMCKYIYIYIGKPPMCDIDFQPFPLRKPLDLQKRHCVTALRGNTFKKTLRVGQVLA